MPKATRVTKFEFERRMAVVSKMLLRGYGCADIMEIVNTDKITEFGFKKPWNLTDRQVRNYVSDCYRRWKKTQTKNHDLILAKHISLREHLYQRNQAENPKLALDVLDSLAKIQGLDKITLEHRVSIDEVLDAISEINPKIADAVRGELSRLISAE